MRLPTLCSRLLAQNAVAFHSPIGRFLSSAVQPLTKVCIVGGGPAGFYVTQHLLKHLSNVQVDIVEKLPVPFGLVRFGVAPDHPEVKNVINTFTKVAESPRVKFYGNVTLGKDIGLKELREAYHAVVLCYGAEHDRTLNIPNEDDHVLSAREFVAWYNGLPDANADRRHQRIAAKLASSRSVSIIGQGNVAVDVARILLSPLDALRRTDITEQALDALSSSSVQTVNLVGRRGPLQAAFTIKELREMLKLPDVHTRWRSADFAGIDAALVAQMARPKKRITELMINSVNTAKPSASMRTFVPIFFRSPVAIVDGKQLRLIVNELKGETAVATSETEILPSDMVLRSIGYKSINVVGDELSFDNRRGLVPNVRGHVLRAGVEANSVSHDNFDETVYERGLYASGWLASGPTGVILTTMNNSFQVASRVCKDFELGLLPEQNSVKPGLDVSRFNRVVTWDGWQRIDQAECEAGQKCGKPREKFVKVDDMLKVALQ